MITDIQVQHELLKTALEATDNYLFVEKRSVAAGKATNEMIHTFTYEMARAHDALQALGVLDKHQSYMANHSATMVKLHGHPDQDVLNQPYVHVPTSDTGEVEESNKGKSRSKPLRESILVSFANFLSENDDESSISDDDINEMVDSLSWEDIIDLYPDADLVEEDEQMDEALSAQARLKKRQSFARGKSKRSTAKGIKLRRASTPAILQKRAQLAARRSIYQRLLRGRDKSTMAASEKDRIEKQVASMKNIQASIATRMVPKMRSIEQKRLAHYRGAGKR